MFGAAQADHLSAEVPRSAPKRSREQRIWLWAQVAIGLALLVWFGRFAYVRWTTPPAAAGRTAPVLTERDRQIERIIRLADALPRYRSKLSGGGAWSAYYDLPREVVYSWDPAQGYDPAGIEAFLTTARSTAVLGQFVRRTAELERGVAHTSPASKGRLTDSSAMFQVVPTELAAPGAPHAGAHAHSGSRVARSPRRVGARPPHSIRMRR